MAEVLVEKYQPLYLKYRPQSLSDLVGQRAVAQTLTNALAHDRICHAYLFTGPRGTGKTSSARILAKSLNCEKGPTANPCLQCTACVEIKEGTSPAVFELDAASNNSVDDARALIERAPLVAQGGRFKLYIIDECHMLTKEAFNALLKTIEEPPDKVVFILATTEEHKVPATIVSRCQRLMFRLVNQTELKEHLRSLAGKEEINIEDEALELIARRSAGGLRDALGLLDQASLLAAKDKAVNVADLLTLLGAVQEDMLLKISEGVRDMNGSVVLQAVQQLLLEGREPTVLIQELAKHFLNLARAGYNKSAAASGIEHSILGSPAYLTALSSQAESYDPAEIAQIVELLDRLDQTCRRSSQPALNLEIGLLSICHRHDISLVKDLNQRLVNVESALTENGVQFTAQRPRQGPAADKYGAPKQKEHSPPPAAQPEPQAPVRASTHAETSKPDILADVPGQESAPQTVSGENEEEEVLSIVIDEHIAPPDVEPDDAAVAISGGGGESLAQTASAIAVATAGAVATTVDSPVRANDTIEECSDDNAAVTAVDGSENELGVPLDELWSDLKDELQRRHLPTFSIVQTHAFPLNFEKDDLTIGVRKDTFQKMLENKSEHIKAAFTALTGRLITLRIKVVNDSNLLPAARPKSSSTPGKKAELADDVDEYERATGSAGLVESSRTATEFGRSTHESSRTASESGRSTTESSRPTEFGRSTSESSRPATEFGTSTSESRRPATEFGRSTSESSRPTAENGRPTGGEGAATATANGDPSVAAGAAVRQTSLARNESTRELPGSTPRTETDLGGYSSSARVASGAAKTLPDTGVEKENISAPKAPRRSSDQPIDSSLIQEAYKLFEGPGSRLIG